MTGIQVLLIGGSLALFLYYSFRVRNAFTDLLILACSLAAAVFFILSPEKTNAIAHRFGVGRGADMLFYLCILLFSFIILKLFSRIRRLEKQLTAFVRQDAKANAQDHL